MIPKISGLGHVGLFVNDLTFSKDFYCRILGFQVTDEQINDEIQIIFLSLSPELEHHQLVLRPDRQPVSGGKVLNHLALKVDNLTILKEYLKLFEREKVQVTRKGTHGTAITVYFLDPDGNNCEIYVDTPWYIPQPFFEPLLLEQSEEIIWEEVRQVCEAQPGYIPFDTWKFQSKTIIRKNIQ